MINRLSALHGIGNRDTSCKYEHNFLDLAVGSRVQVTHNVSTELGLFKGALGTVHGFGWEGEPPDNSTKQRGNASQFRFNEYPIVFVQMDKYLGKSADANIPNLVPFAIYQSLHKIEKDYHRWQYALQMGHCKTVHSSQGITAENGIIAYPPQSMRYGARGLTYVAISRPRNTEDLFLMNQLTMDQFRNPPAAYKNINSYYDKLRKRKIFLR